MSLKNAWFYQEDTVEDKNLTGKNFFYLTSTVTVDERYRYFVVA
jgi:hypothetical protein